MEQEAWARRKSRFHLLLLLALLTVVVLSGPMARLSADENRPAAPQSTQWVALDQTETAGPIPAGIDATGIAFRVIIERVDATNNFDGPFSWDRADFFARVRIDTSTQESPVISNNDHIMPDWEIGHTAWLDDSIEDEVVTLTIGIWDADDFNVSQEADLTAASNRSINLNIDVDRCLTAGVSGAITGNVSGACGQTLISEGPTGGGTFNTARIEFRVEASGPPTAPGLNVLCLHSPIWPQAGDTVHVAATALADNLATKTVDRIDIFFQNVTTPRGVCANNTGCSASAVAGPSGSSMFYGCQVQDEGVKVWSGWRRLQVGAPPAGQRAVPLIYTGSSRSSIDIVFVPDVDSYSSASDSDFLVDVHRAIRDAYYGAASISSSGLTDADAAFGERIFLSNQDKMNFWIAQDRGDIDGSPDDCFGITLPPSWGADYAFADSGAILHTDSFRDCASPARRIFGSEINASTIWPVIMRHETLHSPFGLADEYCCDSYYFQPSPWPNIYRTQAACLSDILELSEWDAVIGDPPRTAATCRVLPNGWWLSDAEDDLMGPFGSELNGADVRRVAKLFDRCESAACRRLLDKGESIAPLGSPADPLPEFEYNTTQKVVALGLYFLSPNVVAPGTTVVRYGQPPTHEGAPPMLRFDLYDVNNNPIGHYQSWHPLLQLGTLEVDAPILANAAGSEQPNSIHWEHGPAEWLQEMVSHFAIPFSPRLGYVTITNLATNQVIGRLDVRDEIRAFCRDHPQDAECGTLDQSWGYIFMPVTVGD